MEGCRRMADVEDDLLPINRKELSGDDFDFMLLKGELGLEILCVWRLITENLHS